MLPSCPVNALDPTTPAARTPATAVPGVAIGSATVRDDAASATRAARAAALPHGRALDGARGLAGALVLAYPIGVPGRTGGVTPRRPAPPLRGPGE